MKPALIIIILFSSTSAFSQSCDPRIQASIYTLLSVKLYMIAYPVHRMQIADKYDALDNILSEKQRNSTDSEAQQNELQRQSEELYRQRNSEYDNARATAFNNKQKCSDPSFTHDLNLVYVAKKKYCDDPAADTNQEIESVFEGGEESGPVGCTNTSALINDYQAELDSSSIKLPIHRVCEIIMDKLAAKNSSCTEDSFNANVSANNSTNNNSDPNTCEIAGPDGRCPGAPKEVSATPLSSQDMRNLDFLNNGSTLEQRRQRARQGAAR